MSIKDLIPSKKSKHGAGGLSTRRSNHPFHRLRDEMNQLFDDFLPEAYGKFGNFPDPWGTWDFMPEVDVRDTKKAVKVSAELPGVDEKDIDVRLDGNVLTIKGEKREETGGEEEGWTHSECHYGSFTRSIPLDCDVDAEKIDATFKKGVLKITLPKRQPGGQAANRIEVKAG